MAAKLNNIFQKANSDPEVCLENILLGFISDMGHTVVSFQVGFGRFLQVLLMQFGCFGVLKFEIPQAIHCAFLYTLSGFAGCLRRSEIDDYFMGSGRISHRGPCQTETCCRMCTRM